MQEIDFKLIEKKWQNQWESEKVFEVSEKGIGKKYYVLVMFPYPSGSGLHMGHALNYTIGDVYARFKRMQGFNVLNPIGFDSFGLPAENAAIAAKSHPKEFTEMAIKNYIRQLKGLGISYDWNRMIETHKPEYYRWDQWIFLKMFERGLAYKKKSPVNFCPKCNTVLANEQVHNGKCWRHKDAKIKIKHLNQWFFKITDYAEELNNLDKLNNWPEMIKKLQKNWIGKSYGAEIKFKINREEWKIFTTRPDTIFGVTFMVISAQHPRLMELVSEKQKREVENFLKRIKSTSQEDIEKLEKEGVFTGSYAINPMTNEKVPVYAGNFVLADYGSGIVMAVPAHDQRDYEFAKKYKIPIKEVIKGEKSNLRERAHTDKGTLINSGHFNGLNNEEAKEKIIEYLIKEKLGRKTINYRLKDWLISRQRFWGAPIPIVYCEKCGIIPVPEKDLPVKLPENIKFKSEKNPLVDDKKFVETKCPKCGDKAKRETDTMDTFVNSSWYFLRYCDPKNNKEIFDKKKTKYWMPIDQYIGGKEHACMHLIYFRFYTKFLRDLKLIDFDEPAVNLFNQGMLYAENGEMMSKSAGNVVLPETVSEKYGIDTARLFLVSASSPDSDKSWDEKGIEGSLRFISKIFNVNPSSGKMSEKLESKMNSAVKRITEQIEKFQYNLSAIGLREFFDCIEKEPDKKAFETFLKLLHPFCPHITEEFWHKLGNKSFISLEKWPVCDEKKINKSLEDEEKQIEQTKNDVLNILKIMQGKGQKSEIIKLVAIPNEVKMYRENKDYYEKSFNAKVEVYDIKNFKGDKKAKQGKPAIYIS